MAVETKIPAQPEVIADQQGPSIVLGELALVDLQQQADAEQRRLLEQQLLRGDRYVEGESDSGFTIRRLEHEPKPVPVGDLLPFATFNDVRMMTYDLADRIMTGASRLDPTDGSHPFAISVFCPVQASRYETAVTQGLVGPDAFGDSGKVLVTQQEGIDALNPLVEPAKRRDSLVGAIWKRGAYYAKEHYVDDLDLVYNPKGLEALEVYDMTDGNNDVDEQPSIRLLNLSNRKLSKQQLERTVNLIRSKTDESQGALFDGLDTIVILPEDHPSLRIMRQIGNRNVVIPISGRGEGRSIIMSERLLQPPEERKPRPEADQSIRDFYDKYRLDGEPTDDEGGPMDRVGDGEWEPTLAHELEHIALKENDVALPGPGPTRYSRDSKREHEAELAALKYMGGEAALAVPDEQRAAKEKMWEAERGERPIGPHYISCKELDLAAGPLPLRLRRPGRPIPAKVTYQLTA